MVWHKKKQVCQKELGQFGEKTPLNQPSQKLNLFEKNGKFWPRLFYNHLRD